MSEFKGDTASSASERPERRETVLTLNTARSMLPLVQRIVRDLIASQQDQARLQPEQDRLQRLRRTLNWPERSRRYQVEEDLKSLERSRQQALAELESLSLTLLDPEKGRVGFPTIVNGRRAYFTWRPGDEALRYWHFAGETVLRPIPTAWFDPVAVS